MRVLIDTNIALTYVSGREDRFSDEVDLIMKKCAEEEIEGAIAFHSLSTIWYQARKLPEETRREWIRQICELLTVTGASNEALLEASDILPPPSLTLRGGGFSVKNTCAFR